MTHAKSQRKLARCDAIVGSPCRTFARSISASTRPSWTARCRPGHRCRPRATWPAGCRPVRGRSSGPAHSWSGEAYLVGRAAAGTVDKQRGLQEGAAGKWAAPWFAWRAHGTTGEARDLLMTGMNKGHVMSGREPTYAVSGRAETSATPMRAACIVLGLAPFDFSVAAWFRERARARDEATCGSFVTCYVRA
jgi:hypothetical protein